MTALRGLRCCSASALVAVVLCAPLSAQPAPGAPLASEQKVLLWGDTHLHTSNSFDAYLNGNRSAGPDTAFRFARGKPVLHPFTRTRVQIGTPLDFLVVSDHAEFYGGIKDIYERGIQDPDAGLLRGLIYRYTAWSFRRAIDRGEGQALFTDALPENSDPQAAAEQWAESTAQQAVPGADVSLRNAWQRMLDAVERHHQPGEFTALIGWEWSSNPGGANLHRVVVTDAAPQQARGLLPFGSDQSPYPMDLWAWLAEQEAALEARFLAIPHNSNISRDLMFSPTRLNGEPVDAAYAAASARFEPVVEVTQIKGDSEAHPALSPDDPFAGFEPYPYYHQQSRTENYAVGKGDFVRSGLRQGLELEQDLGINPFRFGMIGSTDSHTGLATAEEPNFWGKMAYDSIPERKQDLALGQGPTGWTMQAGGLAAVWATENSRSAILDALQRREVYATTGPRIRLQVQALQPSGDSTAMGGEYVAGAGAPTFRISAMSDPASAHLDRIQVIKGWIDASGGSRERVVDVVWAGDRALDNGRLPPVGDTVDRHTGSYRNSIGAPSLNIDWQDPAFDPDQFAFYYVRVLEIPTPRHSLLDAIALGMERASEGPDVIQERAYSSPIWQRPRSARRH